MEALPCNSPSKGEVFTLALGNSWGFGVMGLASARPTQNHLSRTFRASGRSEMGQMIQGIFIKTPGRSAHIWEFPTTRGPNTVTNTDPKLRGSYSQDNHKQDPIYRNRYGVRRRSALSFVISTRDPSKRAGPQKL